MKRGVVMSIHKQHAVVMTADGQFLQAPIQGKPQIGEEITFEEECKKPRAFKPYYRYSSAAAIVLLLFVPFLFFMLRDAHPVVAYMSMDINPSVELGVDGNEKVRELRALNEDGEIIIKGLNYKGVNVETVAASILERAKGSHYLDTPNKDIFIASVLIDDKSAHKIDFENILTEKVDQKLRSVLAQLAAEAASANITTLSVPNEVRQEAAANGISSGKMAVYLMAKDEGYKLELEQLKQQSIDKVTEPIGGVKTIVDNAEDTSKKKLKELVAREQEEKAMQQKANKKSNASKPSATPKINKPVKAEKPEKPVSNGVNRALETNKPWKNRGWTILPTITPGKLMKPNSPNKSNEVKKDNKNKENQRDSNWNRSNNDDDNDDEHDRRDNWKQNNNDQKNNGNNDRDDSGNDDRSGRENNVGDDKNTDEKSSGTKQDKDKQDGRNEQSNDD